jgi:hypothetical protein
MENIQDMQLIYQTAAIDIKIEVTEKEILQEVAEL